MVLFPEKLAESKENTSRSLFELLELFYFNFEQVEKNFKRLSNRHKFLCIRGIIKTSSIIKDNERKLIEKIIQSIDWRKLTFNEKIKAVVQSNHCQEVLLKIISSINWKRFSWKTLTMAVENSDYNILILLSVLKTKKLLVKKRIELLQKALKVKNGRILDKQIKETLIQTNNWASMSNEEMCLFLKITKGDPEISKIVVNTIKWENLNVPQKIALIKLAKLKDQPCDKRLVQKANE